MVDSNKGGQAWTVRRNEMYKKGKEGRVRSSTGIKGTGKEREPKQHR